MWSDLRYAARSLSRRPLVTAVAVLSLALGIGVNAAIFSVFERLLLRRLPVASPEEIVNVVSPGPRTGSRSTSDAGGTDAIFSYPLFRDLERVETRSLRMAAHRDFAANLAYRGRTMKGEGLLVSGGYFSALGIAPAIGRLIGRDDDRVPGAHPVVVLSHTYWETRFGADAAVVGHTLVVNGEAMTIVGVAPAGFWGTTTMERPQVFVPLMMAERALRVPEWNGFSARDNHWLYVFARLAPGVSREAAEALVNVPFAALMTDVEFPAVRSGLDERAREQFQQRRIVLEEGATGRSRDRIDVRNILLLLFAVTIFVLAIACANVANLLLTRAADRLPEISIRLSLGGSAWRLFRMLLVETCVLGMLGGLCALAVAQATLGGLMAIMPPDDGPLLDFEINTAVLLFTLALGVGTSLLFGLFPAVHGVRRAVATGLHAQSGRTTVSRSANRVRSTLATAQIALATALLALAGLFVVSLVNLSRVELGIRRDGLVTFSLSPYLNGYTSNQSRALFDRLEDELRAIPGVGSVTASTNPILSNNGWNNNVTVEGFQSGPGTNTVASAASISTDYFGTLGIPILAGREFTRADAWGSPRVAVVNEAFARRFNLGSRGTGRRMRLGAGDDRPLDIEIVGVVGDAKYSDVRSPVPAQFFLPYRQMAAGTLTFYVRTSSSAGALLTAIPPVISRLDANLPISNLRTMDEQIWDNTTSERVLTTLSSSFAVLATLLAAIGLYAVVAYGVAQRFREIGIRIALGAKSRDVRWLVLSHVGRLALVGAAIGGSLAVVLGRAGAAMLYGVEGHDAGVLGGAALLALAVSLGAGLLPARRAVSINPVQALRAE
jgi:predicted permease